jgi:hypothetical protein
LKVRDPVQLPKILEAPDPVRKVGMGKEDVVQMSCKELFLPLIELVLCREHTLSWGGRLWLASVHSLAPRWCWRRVKLL